MDEEIKTLLESRGFEHIIETSFNGTETNFFLHGTSVIRISYTEDEDQEVIDELLDNKTIF